MALACAPCTLTLNLHQVRMTTNGRTLLLQLVLSCGMIASFVNSISPSLLFNTYWIALLMEYLPFFLGSISSSYDKSFSNFGLISSFRLFVIYSVCFSVIFFLDVFDLSMTSIFLSVKFLTKRNNPRIHQSLLAIL